MITNNKQQTTNNEKLRIRNKQQMIAKILVTNNIRNYQMKKNAQPPAQHTTYLIQPQINSLWLWQHPSLDQYNTKKQKK